MQIFCEIGSIFSANQPDAVSTLLKADAEIDFGTPESRPPVMAAIVAGNIETLQLLIEAGAQIDGPIYNGGDALLMALVAEDYDIVALLLEAGAEPSGRTDVLQNWRRSKVRRFLRDNGYEEVREAAAEVWEKRSDGGSINRVTLPEVRRSYSFEQLIEIVR